MDLELEANLVALVIGSTALVTMLVAATIAWNAVRVRPLDVLQFE